MTRRFRNIQWTRVYSMRVLSSYVLLIRRKPSYNLRLFGKTRKRQKVNVLVLLCKILYQHTYIAYRTLLIFKLLDQLIGLVGRVFANGPGDLGSNPGCVIPKTLKMVLDTSLLNNQHYKVRIKGKVEQSREGVAPSPTPWCSSIWKGSLRVTLDYGRQLYLHTPR